MQWADFDLGASRLSIKHMLGDHGESSEFVFRDRKGGSLRRQNVLRRSFRTVVEATKTAIAVIDETAADQFSAIRFHDLRHSAATLTLASGIHAQVVQETLTFHDCRHPGHLLARPAVDAT